MLLLPLRLAPADPVQPVRKVAEWEPAFGTLIRWPLGIPSTFVMELAADDSLYVLVENQSQENSARSAFVSWGVDLSVVRFIRANTYSHWTRGWEEDDAVNAAVASALGAPLHAVPAFCTGGNIMVDGHGTAFSSRQMVDENAGLWTEPEFRQIMETHLGITNHHILDNPEIHGIQHIDCYAKIVDEETIIVKEVVPGHPEYACIEDMVAALESLTSCYGRPYGIVRVFCASYHHDDVAAYTNSLILNRKVLVPLFGISSDAAALETYRAAMPGYEVIGFPYGSWYYYDALHCRAMGMFDRHMLRILHRRLDAVMPEAAEYVIEAMIDDRGEMGLVEEMLLLRWRLHGEETWNSERLVATSAPDSFAAPIPGRAPGVIVEYYLTAEDHSGRREALPRTAPDGFYAFMIEEAVGAPLPGDPASPRLLRVGPNPFRSALAIRMDLPSASPISVAVFDASGRRVSTLLEGIVSRGAHQICWNGRTGDGHTCASGVYFINLHSNRGTETVGALLLN